MQNIIKEETNNEEASMNKSKSQSEFSYLNTKKPSIKDYEILLELGRGSYAKVCLAKAIADSSKVAIKIIDKEFLNRVN